MGYGGEPRVWLPKCIGVFTHPTHRDWGTALNPPAQARSQGSMEHPSPCTGRRDRDGGQAISKALPTPSHSALGALVVLGMEASRRSGGCSLLPVSRGEQRQGVKGKTSEDDVGVGRTRWGSPLPAGRGFGEGTAGTKRYPATEHPRSASRGHAGRGHGGAERSP